MPEPSLGNTPETQRERPAWLVPLLLIALVLLAVLRSHAGTRLDSFTIDEPWHIVAGASYVSTGDWRLNPEHPPLTKLWVGAFMPGSVLALRPFRPLVDKVQERDFVESTVYLDNDALAVQQRARLAMWAFNGLLLFLVGVLVWQVFGPVAAGTLLALAALEPTLSAHMPLVMTDLPLGLTLLLAAGCAGLLASDWRWRSVLLTGLAMGLALTTKHSALAGLAALGAGLVLVLAWQSRQAGWRRSFKRLGQLAIVALIAVAVLWAQYGLRFHTSPDGSDPLNRETSAKIDDLKRPVLKSLLHTADQYRLLPRPYIWGLADTVRAGVDGRGQAEYLLWGKLYLDGQPWHTWPSQIISKLPLATLLMIVLALVVLPRTRPSSRERLCLLMVLVMAGGHFAALAGSQGSYAGIRHALPVVLALLLLVALAVRQLVAELREPTPGRRVRVELAAFAAMVVVLLVATLPEPRLYEFHNRLAGGTADAWRNFGNESMELGQRFHEVKAFHDEVIVRDDLPFFGGKSRQTEGAGLRSRQWVESLDDDNVEGVFEGYFLTSMPAMLPAPHWDWDPDTFYGETEQVFRAGFTQIRKGRVVDQRARANGIAARLRDYIYRDNGDDWALVARRIDEILAVNPLMVPAYIELGNAHVRLGQRDQALAAYRGLVELKQVPIDPDIIASIRRQIALIEASPTMDDVAPMRQPFME